MMKRTCLGKTIERLAIAAVVSTFFFTCGLGRGRAQNAPADSVTQPDPAGKFDGPAELPRVYIDSSTTATPAKGKTWDVKAGTRLREIMDKVSCGDTVRLEAGATFPALPLPDKSCDDGHWIVIRTSASDSKLPPEGTRLTPCYAGISSLPGRPPLNCASTENVLARILLEGRGAANVRFADNANHYRLVGLEITRAAGTGSIANLVGMNTAHHVVFDHVWVHGTANDETTRGIWLAGSRYIAIVDSYINDFHCIAKVGSCTDAQAVSGGINGHPMGPYKIVNNFLEGAGENFMLGGGGGAETPYDVEIRHNHIFKPLSWKTGSPDFVGGPDGHPFIVKNLFELKNAARVLFEGNILENSWGGFTQFGFGILLTPRNQSAQCPNCRVHDVTIRYNLLRHTGAGIQIFNAPDAGGFPKAGERYSIHDIVIEEVNGAENFGNGVMFQISTSSTILNHVSIDHITAFSDPDKIFLMVGNRTGTKMPGFQLTNSMVTVGRNEIFSTTGDRENCAAGRGSPRVVIENCFSSFAVKGNVFIGGGGGWPDGNFTASKPESVGFVNFSDGRGGDYRLCHGKDSPVSCTRASKFVGVASDHKDPGADMDALKAAITGVR